MRGGGGKPNNIPAGLDMNVWEDSFDELFEWVNLRAPLTNVYAHYGQFDGDYLGRTTRNLSNGLAVILQANKLEEKAIAPIFPKLMGVSSVVYNVEDDDDEQYKQRVDCYYYSIPIPPSTPASPHDSLTNYLRTLQRQYTQLQPSVCFTKSLDVFHGICTFIRSYVTFASTNRFVNNQLTCENLQIYGNRNIIMTNVEFGWFQNLSKCAYITKLKQLLATPLRMHPVPMNPPDLTAYKLKLTPSQIWDNAQKTLEQYQHRNVEQGIIYDLITLMFSYLLETRYQLHPNWFRVKNLTAFIDVQEVNNVLRSINTYAALDCVYAICARFLLFVKNVTTEAPVQISILPELDKPFPEVKVPNTKYLNDFKARFFAELVAQQTHPNVCKAIIDKIKTPPLTQLPQGFVLERDDIKVSNTPINIHHGALILQRCNELEDTNKTKIFMRYDTKCSTTYTASFWPIEYQPIINAETYTTIPAKASEYNDTNALQDMFNRFVPLYQSFAQTHKFVHGSLTPDKIYIDINKFVIADVCAAYFDEQGNDNDLCISINDTIKKLAVDLKCELIQTQEHPCKKPRHHGGKSKQYKLFLDKKSDKRFIMKNKQKWYLHEHKGQYRYVGSEKTQIRLL